MFCLMHVCFCCVRFSLSVLSQENGSEECLRNDLFCVGWCYVSGRFCDRCVVNFTIRGLQGLPDYVMIVSAKEHQLSRVGSYNVCYRRAASSSVCKECSNEP